MLRTVLTVLACQMLQACSGWTSDQRLFGDGDWAHLDINGRYEIDAHGPAVRGIFRTRPDGLIEGRSLDKRDKNVMLIGLVPIKGGSGDYFLAVDRSDRSPDSRDDYLIVHLSAGKSLEYFTPDCAGTSAVSGMIKVPAGELGVPLRTGADRASRDAPNTGAGNDHEHLLCKFFTKDALMVAALEAEKFLSAKHVVAVTPFATLSRDHGDRATRRPPPRPSRRSPAARARRR